MRRLFSGLLAVVLLLSPAACGQADPSSAVPASGASVSSLSQAENDQQTDGLSLYREALQRLALQVEEGSFRCGYSVENDSGAYVISTTGVMAVSHKDGFCFSNQTQTESGGSALVSSWFSDGGQVYAAAQGVTRRQAYDQTAKERLTRLIRSYSYGLIDPAEAAAESQSVTPTDTGLTVSLILKAGSLSSVEKNYGEIFGSPYQIVGMELEAQLDQENNLASAALHTEVCTTVEGQIASFTLSVQLYFSDLGADLSIQPPPEIDMETAQAADSLWAA
ncbi:MAG: hypothetical protein HFE86_05260 [Clostridiales bacterium]|nr:hypothetical protein [Clostridiales bacterium]